MIFSSGVAAAGSAANALPVRGSVASGATSRSGFSANGRSRRCPCGTVINAANEDELVTLTQKHLAAEHPGREYTRDEILFMAAW